MQHNARGGLVVRGLGAASEGLYVDEGDGLAWAGGLCGWNIKRLARRAERWRKRMKLEGADK